MSEAEKISLLSGSGIWTIPGVAGTAAITVSDGPHGVRKPISDLALQTAHPATCFPAGCAMAASWNTEAMERLGKALSRECEEYGISILLGPAMNLKRHPAGGRNLEYLSEDPLLTGRLAAAYINGVQASQKVGACPKHFAVNNQESHRFVVDAIVDERTLRELYLKSFEIVVKTCDPPPSMIMGAYNKLNGTYCCENEWLLQQILRDEWKFKGVCVTDWGATNDRIAAIRAGMDVEMPGNGGIFRRSIQQASRADSTFQSQMDSCASRVLDLLQRIPTPTGTGDCKAVFDINHEVAYELALECPVLLQNEGSLLPLSRETSIAVIGEFSKISRYQGMGSSHVTPTRMNDALEYLARYTNSVVYAPGYPALATEDVVDTVLVAEAETMARQSDVVLLFLGLPEILESEGFDRETLKLPRHHIALLEALCSIHDKIVLILSNGGMVELPSCVSKVSSIVEAYLLGQAGGRALADLIFGKVSPSGRLPETMMMSAQDLPSDEYFPGNRNRVEYREGLNVGYRYFDSCLHITPKSHSERVRFPFGHGLTYTRFEYSNLHVGLVCGSADTTEVKVTVTIKNVGAMEGMEVVQLYIAPLSSSVYRPLHELKAFTKVKAARQESVEVGFVLKADDFSFYDIGLGQWIVEPGDYAIEIGASSQDIRLRHEIILKTGVDPSTTARESYSRRHAFSTDDASFAKRFGDSIAQRCVLDAAQQDREGETSALIVNRNSLLKEVAKHSRLVGGFLLWLTFTIASLEVPAGPMKQAELHMLRVNVQNLPLRSLVLFGKGAISMETMDGMIGLMNFQPGKMMLSFGRATYYWLVSFFGI